MVAVHERHEKDGMMVMLVVCGKIGRMFVYVQWKWHTPWESSSRD